MSSPLRRLFPQHLGADLYRRGSHGHDNAVLVQEFAGEEAISRPRRTTRPRPSSRPGVAGRRNCTCRSVVGAKSPGSSPATRAGPSVSSSIAARKPPWTAPAGFKKAPVALNATSIVPLSGSTETSSQPRVAADAGSGILPIAASQDGPSRGIAEAYRRSSGANSPRRSDLIRTAAALFTALVSSRPSAGGSRRARCPDDPFRLPGHSGPAGSSRTAPRCRSTWIGAVQCPR